MTKTVCIVGESRLIISDTFAEYRRRWSFGACRSQNAVTQYCPWRIQSYHLRCPEGYWRTVAYVQDGQWQTGPPIYVGEPEQAYNAV